MRELPSTIFDRPCRTRVGMKYSLSKFGFKPEREKGGEALFPFTTRERHRWSKPGVGSTLVLGQR